MRRLLLALISTVALAQDADWFSHPVPEGLRGPVHVVIVTRTDFAGAPASLKTSTTYDRDAQVIEFEEYGPDGSQTEHVVIQRQHGQQQRMTITRPSGVTTTEFRYENGVLAEEITNGPKDRYERVVIVRNPDGTTEMFTYNRVGELLQRMSNKRPKGVEITTLADGSTRETHTTTSSKGSLHTAWQVRDASGREVESGNDELLEDGRRIYDRLTLQHDNAGRLSEERHFALDGTERIYRYVYEEDSYGNWTRQTVTRSEPPTAAPVVTAIETRSITYY